MKSAVGAMPAALEELLTVSEVAALWRCSENTVYRRIAKGLLRVIDIGDGRAKTRVPASALAEYVAQNSRTAPRGGVR